MRKLLFCLSCKRYTLKGSCALCSAATVVQKPPRFSLEDPYGKYRREAKRAQLTAQGLL